MMDEEGELEQRARMFMRRRWSRGGREFARLVFRIPSFSRRPPDSRVAVAQVQLNFEDLMAWSVNAQTEAFSFDPGELLQIVGGTCQSRHGINRRHFALLSWTLCYDAGPMACLKPRPHSLEPRLAGEYGSFVLLPLPLWILAYEQALRLWSKVTAPASPGGLLSNLFVQKQSSPRVAHAGATQSQTKPCAAFFHMQAAASRFPCTVQ
eukprot:s1230_g8.t1